MSHQYQHLDMSDRARIMRLDAQGLSARAIAKIVGRHHSTIARELKRNTFPKQEGYLDYLAEEAAVKRKSLAHQRPRLKSPQIRKYACSKLEQGWSPEQIAGRISKELQGAAISHEAIYQWIFADRIDLARHLVRRHRERLPKGYSRKIGQNHIPYRVPVVKRPASINKRTSMGHWETDTVVSRSNKVTLLVMVERKSRYTHICKLSQKRALKVQSALIRTLGAYPKKLRRSITYDNGCENMYHHRVNKILKTKSYFCAPFHSWEKGTVENTIGLIRRYLPKKTDFHKISRKQLNDIQKSLNNRPRKCLNYQTPAEFLSQSVALTG